jgi:serine/threonine protein kinase/tetratricopeptide (TPR) repeat protein
VGCLTDQTLDELVAGTLTPEEEEATRAHLADCEACRKKFEHQLGVFSELKGGLTDESETDDDATAAEGAAGRRAKQAQYEADEGLARGMSVGRYIVVEKLARGGMGVVYIAYDPELHRRVAIKLLLAKVKRTESSTSGRSRLLREAQAMARLSHPNVITVYDVGTFEDAVFLALEFIDGENLSKWLKREKRDWRAVLRTCIAAGRGLAAAHAAGLVHRDFKPDNVLIGKDGRVLVMDFGLAREVTDDEGDPPSGESRGSQPSISESGGSQSSIGSQPRIPSTPSRGSDPSISPASGMPRRGSRPSIPNTPLSMPLTKFGTIMGTPGYVAPEHLEGALADARSDQFSFATSMYAALYGRKPYPAKSFKEYRAEVAAGFPEPPTVGVPSWVRRVVERGLAIDPAARFPSMDAMLDELERDPAVRRKRVALAAGAIMVLAIAVGTTVVATSGGHGDAAMCTGAEAKLVGVWDPARREQVRTAFLATKRSYAQPAFDAVAKRFDERARAWIAMRTETCEATQRRKEQPESVMVVRMACLDQRLRETGQLVDVFAQGDGTVVERAVGATSALSSLDDCADVTRLLAAVEPPKDAATRAKVEELRVALGKAKVLTDAGKYADAAAIAKQATSDARKLAYRPIVAAALVQLGELQSYLGDRETSAATLRESIRTADASRDDAVRARAFTWLVGVVGYDLEKPAEGLVLAEDARAALERIGGDVRLEATLESNLGRIYSVTDSYEPMLEHHTKALELRRRVYGDDDPNTANAQNNVAAALNSLGRITEALAGHRKALAMREKALGHAHPNVAMSLANIGSQLEALGELDEGVRVTDEALAIARPSLPTKSTLILISLGNRGSMLGEYGRFDDAQATYDELFKTIRAEQPKSLRMVRNLANYSVSVLTPSGRMKEGLATAEQALALGAELEGGSKTEDFALALNAKAEALEALGKLDDAEIAQRAALAIYEKSSGHDTPSSVDPLTGIGRIAIARGKPVEAVEALSRVLAICEKSALRGKWLARTQFQLARAVVGSDKPRAVKLATEARVWYATSPLAGDLREIDAWLAANH